MRSSSEWKVMTARRPPGARQAMASGRACRRACRRVGSGVWGAAEQAGRQAPSPPPPRLVNPFLGGSAWRQGPACMREEGLGRARPSGRRLKAACQLLCGGPPSAHRSHALQLAVDGDAQRLEGAGGGVLVLGVGAASLAAAAAAAPRAADGPDQLLGGGQRGLLPGSNDSASGERRRVEGASRDWEQPGCSFQPASWSAASWRSQHLHSRRPTQPHAHKPLLPV